MLLVVTISSQGSKLRVKDDAKDGVFFLVFIAEVSLNECVFEKTLLFLDSFLNEDRTNRVSFGLRHECQLARGYCS